MLFFPIFLGKSLKVEKIGESRGINALQIT